MAQVIYCRDVGFDCDGVIRANSEEEALQQAARHAREVHGLEKVSPEVVQKLKSIIRNEAGPLSE
jgi:predicted small metal-binding protein